MAPVTPWRTITKRSRQPKRKRRAWFRCGSCGKRHSNPLGHACTGGGGFKAKARTAQRRQAAEARRAKAAAAAERETAGRRARRQREDEQRRARRLRELQAAKARKARAKTAPAPRRTRPAHDYRKCRDGECARPACEAYREGRADEAQAMEGAAT